MLYKEPFVPYLNFSICIILLLLILPTLLNTREQIKIRLAFTCIFLTVIINSTCNVLILYYEYYNLVPLFFLLFFIPLLFGPSVKFYVAHILGYPISKNIAYSFIPGALSFVYGMSILFVDETQKNLISKEILDGNNIWFNGLNLLTLIYILYYCFQSLRLIKTLKPILLQDIEKQKLAWASEFVLYIFVIVTIFTSFLIASLLGWVNISTTEMDLIWMPIFMLFVYLIIAIRSMMMYKSFEFQYLTERMSKESKIQMQRVETARDLHDSLGAHLSLIHAISEKLSMESNFGSNKHYIEKLDYFSKASIQELRNALWVLNNREINIQDLTNQISNFLQQVTGLNAEIELSYTINIHSNISLSANISSNILKIVQELINNAFKHSACKLVNVQILEVNRMFDFIISDNGIGLHNDKETASQYGIKNIHHRAKNIGATLNITSYKKAGTTCHLTLKL